MTDKICQIWVLTKTKKRMYDVINEYVYILVET